MLAAGTAFLEKHPNRPTPPHDTLYVYPVTPVLVLLTRQYKQQHAIVKIIFSVTLTCIKYCNQVAEIHYLKKEKELKNL